MQGNSSSGEEKGKDSARRSRREGRELQKAKEGECPWQKGTLKEGNISKRLPLLKGTGEREEK